MPGLISSRSRNAGGGAGLFGDGSDGSVTIAGTVTLARDMYYDSLTVPSGAVLKPDGFRVFVKNRLTVEAGGAIHADAAHANANAGGAGGSQSNQRPLTRSRNGVNGNTTGAGTNGVGFSESAGGSGGAGGASTSFAGGTASVVPMISVPREGAASRRPQFWIDGLYSSQENDTIKTGLIFAGASGGAGGSDGAGNFSGGSGGGGGPVLLCARSVVNNGRISANGGNGGTPGLGNCGGGGGGGGGWTIVICSSFAGNQPQANGGSGGAGIGTGSAGQPGSAGTARVILV